MSLVSPDLYQQVKDLLLDLDPDAAPLMNWSANDVGFPHTPEKCASEITWIILCAGRSAQSARTIEKKVWNAIREERPVYEAFGYRAKADAIENIWKNRDSYFYSLVRIATKPLEVILDWMETIPYVGPITKYQLARNFGFPVAKPDLHLSRFAGIPDHARMNPRRRFIACQAMCEEISLETGDPIAVIDSLLWLAGNKGFLSVNKECTKIFWSASRPAHMAQCSRR